MSPSDRDPDNRRNLFIATGDELDDSIYPQLYNISARFFFKFLPRPRSPKQPEFLYLPLPEAEEEKSTERHLSLIGLISNWNLAWESAQLRSYMFRDELAKWMPNLRIPSDENIYLLPTTKQRIHEYLPAYMLLPRETVERYGLAPLRRPIWPYSPFYENRDKLLPINLPNRLSDAFASVVWPLLMSGSRMRSFKKDDSLVLLAHNLDYWLPHIFSARRSIDAGLAQSNFGIVILSQSFFRKGWPQRELDGLTSREIDENRRFILPIWHEIEKADVLKFSPPLADAVALNSADGIESIVKRLVKKIRPTDSPLVVARNILLKNGLSPPIVSDEDWLDIIEYKESLLAWPQTGDLRWIFPLPFGNDVKGYERGANIASTVLQMDWSSYADEKKICQLTHPDRVHEFIKMFPGLCETARANPEVLAIYAPQLTLPGFDDGFGDAFDSVMQPGKAESFRYGSPDTVDGNPPLCGDFVAWRHPTLGNYTDEELAYEFVNAHDSSYYRKVFDHFECLVWLLSDESRWMPRKLRDTLIRGTKKRHHWFRDSWKDGRYENLFSHTLHDKSRSTFRFTRVVQASFQTLINDALNNLNYKSDVSKIESEFLAHDFIGAFYDEEARIKSFRRK